MGSRNNRRGKGLSDEQIHKRTHKYTYEAEEVEDSSDEMYEALLVNVEDIGKGRSSRLWCRTDIVCSRSNS